MTPDLGLKGTGEKVRKNITCKVVSVDGRTFFGKTDKQALENSLAIWGDPRLGDTLSPRGAKLSGRSQPTPVLVLVLLVVSSFQTSVFQL